MPTAVRVPTHRVVLDKTVKGLNFRVRHGFGCFPFPMAVGTNYLEQKKIKRFLFCILLPIFGEPMEELKINIIEDTPTLLKFEIENGGNTLPELLMNKLNSYPEVNFATYNIPHPLISHPVFTLRMKKGDAKKALKKAFDELQSTIKEFKKALTKA